MGGQGWYDTTLIVDPSNSAIVYVSGSAGTNSVLRSTNSGVAWTDISTGTGGVGCILSADTTKLTCAGLVSALTTTPTAAHIHTGAAGVEGGVKYTFTLSSVTATSATIAGVFTGLTVSNVAPLDTSGYYVNVHTDADGGFTGGEVRAQLVKK